MPYMAEEALLRSRKREVPRILIVGCEITGMGEKIDKVCFSSRDFRTRSKSLVSKVQRVVGRTSGANQCFIPCLALPMDM